MRNVILFSVLVGLGQLGYSDLSQAQMQVQSKLERLVEVDKQIEALEKQKAQLKGEAAEHLERGGTALLPGASRRNDRAGEEAMQQVQSLNDQIEQLEGQRQQIILELK